MDDDDWSLPGYDVQGRLGDGTGEDLWRGRELATGDVVLLCRLPEDVAPATVRAWQREVGRHALVASPHLLRLRAVVEQDGRTVLVRDHAAGGRLAALAARRRLLDPGEIVTLGIALADALAALHDVGLAHGGVSVERVAFRGDGMPLLDSPAVPDRPENDAAADVVALAGLCAGLAGPGAPELAAVLSDGQSGVLDAHALGAALRRACPAAPVRRGGALPVDVHRPVDQSSPRHMVVAHRSRRPSSGALVSAGAVLVVLAGALGGWWSGRGGAAEPGSAATPHVAATASGAPSSTAEWTAVLDRLDAARATAFAQADDALLAGVWAPGSAGLRGDRRLVRMLSAQGLAAHDVRHHVRQVEVLAASARQARLRVVDVLAAYDVRDAEGSVVSRTPVRGDEAHVVELRRTSDGWRLVEVRPA